jgi:hypothetical protein
VKQLTVVTGNTPGVLAGVASLLGNSGINIEAITAETFGEGAIIRIVTRDSASSLDVLRKNEYQVTDSDVLLVSVEDKPGQLGRVAKRLADEGVNIENIYLLAGKGGRHFFAMKVDRETKARQVLGKDVVERY